MNIRAILKNWTKSTKKRAVLKALSTVLYKYKAIADISLHPLIANCKISTT